MIQYFPIDTKEIKKMSVNPVQPRQKQYHEIMWIQKGSSSFIIDSERFKLTASAFFIIPKSRIHQFLPNQNVEGQVIRFTEDELKNFPRLLFSKFNRISEVKINDFEIKQFELLFKTVQLEWDSSNRSISFLTNLISLIIQRIDSIKQNQFSSRKHYVENLGVLDKFQVLMDEFILEEKAVAFYADKLNLTSRKLNDILKSLFNKSASNFINERIMVEAKRNLIYSDDTIHQIAYGLGFKDNSHFTKFFKNHSDLTPKEFRNISI